MKPFKKILLVCGEEGLPQAVIDRACALATANNAKLTLFDATQRGLGARFRFLDGVTRRMSRSPERQGSEQREERLYGIASDIEKHGVSVQREFANGGGSAGIIAEVRRNGHDLVIKDAAGSRAGRSLFAANTDLHLLRKCPCPVWIIKQNPREQAAGILAAVDPHGTDAERNGRNTLIMDVASALSSIEKRELQVVNAWRFEGESALRSNRRIKISEAEIDRMVRLERENRMALLDGVVENYRIENRRRQLHLIKGDARDVIPVIARKNRIELVVMDAAPGTGIGGMLFGNPAESILDRIDCSVLALKPFGYEAPAKHAAPENAPKRMQLAELEPA